MIAHRVTTKTLILTQQLTRYGKACACSLMLFSVISLAAQADTNPTPKLTGALQTALNDGDTRRVITLYHQLAYYNPSDANYPLALAKEYQLAGQWAQALTQAEKVLALTSTDNEALMLAAESAKELSQWSLSETYYERLLRVTANNGTARVRQRYAAMLNASGRPDEAEQLLKRNEQTTAPNR